MTCPKCMHLLELHYAKRTDGRGCAVEGCTCQVLWSFGRDAPPIELLPLPLPLPMERTTWRPHIRVRWRMGL